jgi:hypothetical protein
MVNYITTQHGRVIQYNLRLRTDGARKFKNDLKAIDIWLHQEGILETLFMKDDHVHTLFFGMNPKKLSQSDKDMLNDYLFGKEEVMLYASEN